MIRFVIAAFRHAGGYALPCALLMSLAPPAAIAQSGDPKSGEAARQLQPASATDLAKDSARKISEFQDAARLINGPAGNPECVWLGRRVVSLMWRDDLDTAFRHIELYDRFGCPGGHIQASFRCLVRSAGMIDAKSPSSLNARIHACWVNPAPEAEASASAPGAKTESKIEGAAAAKKK